MHDIRNVTVGPPPQRTEVPQPVVLVDRIAWQWYLGAAAVPLLGQLVGLVAGIVFMAKSKIGPAIALWATSILALLAWGAIAWVLLFTWMWNEVSDEADSAQRSVRNGVRVQPASPPASPAPTAEAPDVHVYDEEPVPAPATASCGNLTVTAGTTTCAFAQNVFYEYWLASEGGSEPAGTISAYSEGLGRWIDLDCADAGDVTCAAARGAWVEIPREAIDAYTQGMADVFAASHTVSG